MRKPGSVVGAHLPESSLWQTLCECGVVVFGSMGSGARLPGFMSCLSLPGCLLGWVFFSLCLSFLICNMRIIIVST